MWEIFQINICPIIGLNIAWQKPNKLQLGQNYNISAIAATTYDETDILLAWLSSASRLTSYGEMKRAGRLYYWPLLPGL